MWSVRDLLTLGSTPLSSCVGNEDRLPQVYNDFDLIFQGLGISDDDELPNDMEALKRKISEVFLTRTRDEWATVFEARKLIHYAMRRWAVLFHPRVNMSTG